MSASIGKMAPTAVVLAAVCYCCWPYFSGENPAKVASDDSKLPEISPGLLSPEIVPSRGRDPFGNSSPETPAKKKPQDDAKSKPDKKTPKDLAESKKNISETTSRKPSLTSTDVGAILSSTSSSQHAANSDQIPILDLVFAPEQLTPAELATIFGPTPQQWEAEVRDLLDQIQLRATFLGGRTRVAIINNTMYREGESLKPTDSKADSWVVKQILQHRVILSKKDHTVDLNYSNVTAKSSRAKSETASSNDEFPKPKEKVNPKVVRSQFTQAQADPDGYSK